MASSSTTMRSLELYELQASEGPCVDCYRTGTAVLDQDLATSAVDEAFDWLRGHARRNNLRLAALAEDFLSGKVTRSSIEPRDRDPTRHGHVPT